MLGLELETFGRGGSFGILTDVNIQQGDTRLTGSSVSSKPAFQFLGGLRVKLAKHLYLFAEYKYVGTIIKHEWNSEDSPVDPEFSYLTQIIVGGVGLSL